MFIPFHKNFQHGSMHTQLLNAQTIGKQTGRRKQLLSHCSKYVCKAVNRKWPQLLLLSVWLWGYGFVSSEAEWEIKSAGWKGIGRPFQFPLLTLTVPFSLIYFLKGCTKTRASSWTVTGLVVGKGGLGALGATAPAEYETTVKVSFLFWSSISLFLEDLWAVLLLKHSQMKTASCPLLVMHRRGFVLGGYLAKKSRN